MDWGRASHKFSHEAFSNCNELFGHVLCTSEQNQAFSLPALLLNISEIRNEVWAYQKHGIHQDLGHEYFIGGRELKEQIKFRVITEIQLRISMSHYLSEVSKSKYCSFHSQSTELVTCLWVTQAIHSYINVFQNCEKYSWTANHLHFLQINPVHDQVCLTG